MVCRALILAMLFAHRASGDLPVHCLHEQVKGNWIFHVDSGGHDDSISCGHNHPDTNEDHVNKKVHVKEEYTKQITLSDPHLAEDDDGNKGFWTMVYDEGFQVVIAGRTFFAFSFYKANDHGGYDNHCGSTFVGWHRYANNTDWGCYWAEKKTKPKVTQSDPHPFIEQASLLQLEWTPEEKSIHEINQRQSAWKAKVHPQFKGRTMHEVGKMFGNQLHAKMGVKAMHDNRTEEEKFGHLPESWDWRNVEGDNFDGEVRNQGVCGSCYSIAFTSMLEDRIRILTRNKVKANLAEDQVLSCSRYNQGCDGGYPFLAGKYASEFNMLPKECSEEINSCKKACNDNGIAFKVENPHYVGGFYGGCTEAAMMEEVYNHGPIVASLEPNGLMSYWHGVFTDFMATPHAADLRKTGVGGVHPWEKVDHSVLIVGYGQEKDGGMKYWIVKNSWGAEWGESGYFRIRRGTDELAFESMGMAALPVIDNSDQQAAPGWWKSIRHRSHWANHKRAQQATLIEKNDF